MIEVLRQAVEAFEPIVTKLHQDAAIKALKSAIKQLEEAEPDWIELQKQAEAVVRGKPTYKRFIDGTPLSNDISVWMADFAMEHGIYQPVDPAPVASEGWKLVPVEPTREMIDAYLKLQGSFQSARSDWAAMLAAAPEYGK